MIEKILDRLERIDHKEYCGGFEFADSSTFEEMGKCFDERKKLANYVKELQQENKQLKVELQEANDNIIWWSNRFNAVERDNKQLKEEIKKYINSSDFVYDELYKKREKIEKILGDKE